MEVETNSPAGDGSSYSEDWAAIAQEETGQEAAGAASPPAGSGHDRSGPSSLGDQLLPSDRREFSPDAAPPPSSAAGQPAGSGEADDAIWAGAPAELRAAFEREKAGRAQAENTIRSNNARWSSAQRELNVIRAHQAQPAPHRDAAPGRRGSRSGLGDDDSDFGRDAAERDEELLRVGDEYPDIAMPLIEVIADLRAQVSELSTDASRRRELEQSQAELALQEQLAGEEQALARDHPDWSEVVRSQDFADWAMAQPRMVHEALLRNGDGIVDGAEASKILGDFKRDAGSGTSGSGWSSIAQRRGRQMEGARHVPGRQGAIPGEGIGGSYSEEWKRQESEERRREASRR